MNCLACDNTCTWPWTFTFTAEKAFHALIKNNYLAEEYYNMVLVTTNMAKKDREDATYRFIQTSNFDPLFEVMFLCIIYKLAWIEFLI